jgi:15-cis-phytoene synthase
VADELVAYSREVIRSGSKSFAAAASLFAPETRASAYLLYAWCRHCDDQADGQELGHGAVELSPAERSARVDTLYAQTRAALAGEPVEAPVFRAFQAVARRHDLPPAFALDHLQGFRLDADGAPVRTFEDLLAYCYHVAGAVGLMMAWIMGVRDEATLDRACDLGLAFQLTNVARDVVEDAGTGRVYLPETWLREAGVARDALAAPENRAKAHALAARLVREAEPYYVSARWGMARLPFRCAWAIGSARGVYREIGRKLIRTGPSAWDGRLSTSRGEKLTQVARGLGAAAWARSIDQVRQAPPREGLWTRPGRSGGGDRRLAPGRPVHGQQPLGEGA